jgi:hypothetical protein
MLLAYDSQYDQVWTMEANFGATIEVAIRGVNPGWTVGHLVGEHIRADFLQTPDMGDMMTVMLEEEEEEEEGEMAEEPMLR